MGTPLVLGQGKSFFDFLTKIKSTVMTVDFLPHRKAKQDPPTVVVAVMFSHPSIKVARKIHSDVCFSLFRIVVSFLDQKLNVYCIN